MKRCRPITRRSLGFGALGLILGGCAYVPNTLLAVNCGVATPTASPLPALPGPTAVRTTVPAAPTPTPRPIPSPTPTPQYIADPFASLVGQSFSLDQDLTLPSVPASNPLQANWQLAPGQADKATLVGNTLHALKPGGILLVGHAGDRVAYLFEAASQPGVSSYPVGANTSWGNSGLNGARIITSSAEWDSFYKGMFAPPPGSENWTSPPPPPPSTPPIDFSQHSLLLYQGPIGPNVNAIWVTSVSSDTVTLTVTGALAEGEPSTSVYQNLQLKALIPKVPATATVDIEQMPPEVVPSATPFPQPPEVAY